MLSCKDIQKELEAFLSNEADDIKFNEIQNHLNKCPDCSQVLKEAARLSEILHTWHTPEPPSYLYQNLQIKIQSREDHYKKIIFNPYMIKTTLELAKIAAVVVITLIVSQWITSPVSETADDSAIINLYIKEHQRVVSKTASAGFSTSPDTHLRLERDNLFYYEFFDTRPEYTQPGIIMRKPGSQQRITSSDAPAISNGQILTPSQAQSSVNFELVSPPYLYPGYILDKIRKIENRNSLQLLYTNGINTLSLFEQPLAGEQKLAAHDFREYAIYQSQGKSGGTILAWSDNTLSYVLIGNEEISRLMDMAPSISVKINRSKP
jgi:hypothetical protein